MYWVTTPRTHGIVQLIGTRVDSVLSIDSVDTRDTAFWGVLSPDNNPLEPKQRRYIRIADMARVKDQVISRWITDISGPSLAGLLNHLR